MTGHNLLEAAFAAAPDAILVVDPEGRIRRNNARAEAMFGYGPGELVGRPIEDLDRAGAVDGPPRGGATRRLHPGR